MILTLIHGYFYMSSAISVLMVMDSLFMSPVSHDFRYLWA